jgi:hypothetical protein
MKPLVEIQQIADTLIRLPLSIAVVGEDAVVVFERALVVSSAEVCQYRRV